MRAAGRECDLLVVARTEALIADLGLEEALRRAHAYSEAGADMILVHSKQKTPEELVSARVFSCTIRHDRGTQMVRIWIIGIALALALAMPATAQQRSVPQILERLHALCDQDYKPACIKLGFVIGRLQPGIARKLWRDHPEWWWWERW